MEGFVRSRALPLRQAFFDLPAGKETASVPFWQLVGHLIVVKNVWKAFLDWIYRMMKLHVKCRHISKTGHVSKSSLIVLNMCINVSWLMCTLTILIQPNLFLLLQAYVLYRNKILMPTTTFCSLLTALSAFTDTEWKNPPPNKPV